MIRINDLDKRAAESYRIKANRILSGASFPQSVATARFAELLATVEMLDDSLSTLRSELRSMIQREADNNEMIWRLKGQVADLEKKSS
jgi:hypothetical protein